MRPSVAREIYLFLVLGFGNYEPTNTSTGHLMNHTCEYNHFEKNKEQLKDRVIKVVPVKLQT
ncbi:hypothetical protein EPVG_00345 [Emiliania huxleyi virus 201]|nr:hypothetical protein ELVG_00328 [Emiliania huxleyi virus 203]AEP15750.1 hypothetical protein EQVG_00341 [Emiliania huxleyi virus 207]AET98232.1 hypothetical protein EPVG_00345 [Emiliania huxleyi virus 201]